MRPNNPNGARNFECCNNFYTNGEPLSRLTQQCRETVNEIIKVINIDMKNLSIKFYNWNLRREEMCGEIYVQQFIEMSGTRIYDLMLGITPHLSSFSVADFKAIMEYIYQGCTQPYFGFHPVQYLRKFLFLENILADCYAQIHQTIFMNFLGFKSINQSNTHRQSIQKVCYSSPSAHLSASNQNVPFENHRQYQQTLAPPDYDAYQAVDPISQLEQMMPKLQLAFSTQKQIPQQKTLNYNSAAFNTVGRSQLNSHRKKLTSPPICLGVDDRDHSVPNQVPDLVNINQMAMSSAVPYVENTPLPGTVIHVPPLNLVPTDVIQSPIRQIKSNQLESEANSVTQLQTVLNSHQNIIISSPISPLVEHRSRSVPNQISDSSNVNPIYVCEKKNAAAVDSIERSLLQPQPVIDLSRLNIPVANKLYYDMPVLESFSHDSLTEKTLPWETENCVNNPRDSKQPKCLARDHFLVKKFLANHMRWPFTSLSELANSPRPKSLKNSKRSARVAGGTAVIDTECKMQMIDSNRKQ